jgi:hypothetical protein
VPIFVTFSPKKSQKVDTDLKGRHGRPRPITKTA